MLGFADAGVFCAYVFSIVSMLLCVVYGIMNWNVPRADESKEAQEEVSWEKKDQEIADKM